MYPMIKFIFIIMCQKGIYGFPPLESMTGYCSWCPYAIVDKAIARQTYEQSRECVYERDIDACMNGGVECVADSTGKISCMHSVEPYIHEMM